MRRFENYWLEEARWKEEQNRLRRERRKRTREERRARAREQMLTIIGVCLFLLGITLVVLSYAASTAAETPKSAELVFLEPKETTAEVLAANAAAAIPGDDVEAQEPAAVWLRADIPLDENTQELLYAACGETGIRYELALAVVWKETNFRNVVGDGGESYGYMQIQPKWHGERMQRLGVVDLMDPKDNFRVGCDYLAQLLGEYELPQALTAYNSGSPGHSDYADAVMAYMEELE